MERFLEHVRGKKSFQFFLITGSVCALYLLLGVVVFLAFQSRDLDPVTSLLLAESDPKEYFLLAENIKNNFVFSESRTLPFVPEVLRTPGYPFFIATALAIFGTLYSVVFLQIVLVALTAFLIFKIGVQIHSKLLGILAAGLYVLDPTTIFHTFSIFGDILFVFLFVATIYFLFFVAPPRKIAYVAIGMLLGGAILVRPIALFIIPFLVLAFIVIKKESFLSSKTYTPFLFFAFGVALLTVPWTVRNYVHFGKPNLSSIGAYNLLFYNTVEFLSTKKDLPADTVRDEIKEALGNPDRDVLRSLAMSGVYKEKTNEYLEGQKIEYIIFHLIKTIPFFLGSSVDIVEGTLRSQLLLPPKEKQRGNLSSLLLRGDIKGLYNELQKQGFLVLAERLVWAMLLLGVLCSVFLAKEKRFVALLFLGIVFYYALLTGPVSFPRYRLPAEPFLFLGGTWGLLQIKSWMFQKKRFS